MTSLLDLQQVCHIIEILRSAKVLLPVDSVIGKACGGIAAAEETVSSTLPLS